VVLWTPEARADVANIHAYSAQHASPARASTVVRAITARANLLDQFKGLGKAGSLPHTREYKIARLPYIIVYTVRDEDVVILRVWHERQDRP
jgi:toxin ParE1/3/4